MKKEQTDTFQLVSKGQHMYFKFEDILCFYRYGRNVYLIIEDGREFLVRHTISQLDELHQDNGFVRINRGMLINTHIITGYTTGDRKNTLQLVIHERYSNLVSTLGKMQFQVTKEYISGFKDTLEG